ncbi:MAG: hypothetical protein QMO91_01840 [Candidatus Tisiphia sp.]|nr:hypothetical protein [Candidatus Tisiphia sp.]
MAKQKHTTIQYHYISSNENLMFRTKIGNSKGSVAFVASDL